MDGLVLFSCLVNDQKEQLVILQKRVSKDQTLSIELPKDAKELEFCTVYPQVLDDIASNFMITFDHVYSDEDECIDVKKVKCTPRRRGNKLELRVDEESMGTGDLFMTEPIAYTHDARPDFRLALPTLLTTTETPEVIAPLDIFTLNTTKMAGKHIIPKPTAFRWDLFKCTEFPVMKVMRYYNCPDRTKEFNCHRYFQTLSTVKTKATRNEFISGDGSKFIDNTNLRVVSYQEHQLGAMPMVGGCYLTKEGLEDPYYFGSDIGGCTFDEEPGCLKMTTGNGRVFYIDPTSRAEIDGREFLYFKP